MKKIAALLVILLLAALPAFAAVTANSVITAQTPNRGILQFTSSSSAGTYATLYTAGSNGSKCYGMQMTNSDSATHLVTVQLVNATVKYGGVALTTVATAGFANAVPPQSMMSAIVWPGLAVDSDGNPFIMLISGDTLQATFATAITAATVLNLQLTCVDF
jgi:hypothetical protein